jgi:phosphatidate cytidylyltransferase
VLAVTLVGILHSISMKALCLIISITAAIAGTAGDLFESKLKRLAGVKDSGQIMPGHGGFLDRFDSLLVATTVAWVVLYLLSYTQKFRATKLCTLRRETSFSQQSVLPLPFNYLQ